MNKEHDANHDSIRAALGDVEQKAKGILEEAMQARNEAVDFLERAESIRSEVMATADGSDNFIAQQGVSY